MATSSEEKQQQQHEETDSGCDFFAWDEASQLYYHSRSGFYHDPRVGWYYNTHDGNYYKFEDGNYVLLDSYEFQGPESGTQSCIESNEHPSPEKNNVGCGPADAACSSFRGDADEGDRAVYNSALTLTHRLEDTLIDLYLSGYSGAAASAADDARLLSETGDGKSPLLVDGDDTIHEQGAAGSSEGLTSEDISWDEENWRAQYGQVTRNEEDPLPEFQVLNLWDWALIRERKRDGKSEVIRLVGQLLEPSTKLHPSMSSGGGRLKTAPICEVNLDLVRVKSGKVYKLRSPSMGYISTLSSYDASNPTNDWGFPELTIASINECNESTIRQVASGNGSSSQFGQLSISRKVKRMNHVYRDRAAERRALHGGFGVGPGQKSEILGGRSSSPFSTTTEEAGSEALDLSFGTGSYARRMLENMGWKEGEGLGKVKQGLREPLQAVGNKGSAGLGWN
ncbi:SUPPRESSOR OF ABI3-5-like protein [Drosera capensis]